MEPQAILRRGLVVAVLLPFCAQARVGETEEESAKRYGKPFDYHLDKSHPILVLPGVLSQSYKYQGWIIRCAFLNGKTARILYVKDPVAPIKDDEAAAILEGEAGGGK